MTFDKKTLFGGLGKLKYLKELNLVGFLRTRIHAEALAEVLPSLQLLEKLVLHSSDEIEFVDSWTDEKLFAALGKLKYLKELNLKHFSVTEIDVETLAQVLPSLQLLERLVLELYLNKNDDSCVKQLFGALEN